MIVTKENVAAQAFARHFLRLELPSSINGLVGRLVGYVELQEGPANKTDLDVCLPFMMSCAASLLGVVVVSTKNVRNRTARLPSGWKRWTSLSTMRDSNIAT